MKLYKLVIVEDVEKIRKSLKEYIDWQSLGFQVVETFENGALALDYITENPCDVVMTDIMMGVMTGLELIKNLRKIYD